MEFLDMVCVFYQKAPKLILHVEEHVENEEKYRAPFISSFFSVIYWKWSKS